MPFTTKQLDALRPGPARRVLTETGVPPDLRGLQVWVNVSGTKTFALRYKVAGRTRYTVLGDYGPGSGKLTLADAHARVLELRTKLKAGIDPKVEQQARQRANREAPTVTDVYREFRDEYLRKRRKRPAEAEAVIENHVVTPWGARRADSITTREIVELVREIRDRRGPRIAEVVKGLVGQMFRHAALTGLLPVIPATTLPVIGSRWVQRERVLTDDEIRRVWTKLDDARMDPALRLALRALLVTGQRRQEIALARWVDVDWKGKLWTIPPANSKNGRAHVVPLSALALQLFRQLEELRRDGHEFVVPSRLRAVRPVDPMALTRAVRNNLVHFEMAEQPWTPHDMRRTVATRLHALGVPRLHVARVLNHTDQAVTAGYDQHDYLAEKREALHTWGKALADVLAGKPVRKARVRK